MRSQSLSSRCLNLWFNCHRVVVLLALLGCVFLNTHQTLVANEGEELFENSIRPLLVKQCFGCHGPKKQWASLRLDSPAFLMKGGDSGPVIVPEHPDKSELLTRVSATDDSRMPPPDEGKALTAIQIRDLRQWIELGSPWPKALKPTDNSVAKQQAEHWAFQPVVRPQVPQLEEDRWSQNPIDHFILRKLREAKLKPSPRADRRTLVRRLYYDLVGLPPSPAEVQAFVADDSPDAYAKLADQLLASPHYGEKWGRHWLDVARYSDTKGYVYAREQRQFVHSSIYRDWVISAFNSDLPYDRFVLLQLAADQTAEDPADLAAMGLLTLGRRFLGVNPDIYDDRIDVIGRGLLGLTIGCARCHDHKYDPIPTRDYYSLYGVFQNCREVLEPAYPATEAPAPAAELLKKLAEAEQKSTTLHQKHRAEASQRVRDRIGEYLLSQRALDQYPDVAFSQLLKKEDLIPATVWRLQNYLKTAREQQDPVFAPYWSYADLKDENFSQAVPEIHAKLQQSTVNSNARVKAAFSEPPQSPTDVANRYARLFKEIDAKWRDACATAISNKQSLPLALENADEEALRQVLYGPNSPCVVPDEPITNIEYFFDLGTTTALWKAQNEVDKVLLTSQHAAPHAVILRDREHPIEARVFRRGSSENKGEVAPRQFLKVLSDPNRQPFTTGSGRLELAEAIIDPMNPLTTRVWVNRIWMHHFGEGLVDTPSDFGLRSNAPSHPELLDWLASEFMEQGWSTKQLHRLIVMSATYQQQSLQPADTDLAARTEKLDPKNRLLWKMNASRLSFEQYRDTLAELSGTLDRSIGGDPVELFPGGASRYRRSVYGKIDRQYLPTILRIFDFANPDLHTAQRGETTSPQQALFALNHPFVAAQAKRLAAHLSSKDKENSPQEFVESLYQQVLQRSPTDEELDLAVRFLRPEKATEPEGANSPTASAWAYGYGEVESESGRTMSFTPLPHTAAGALQGGPKFPDPKLGWVQLTATGGHPGNDLEHAAIRRWTAPRAMKLKINSELIHQPPQGDGIRYYVLSSKSGKLAEGKLHKSSRRVDLELAVEQGEHLDFVVDIASTLAYDQFLWSPVIREQAMAKADQTPLIWDAKQDFPVSSSTEMLTPRQQLAQLLLISNELLFVD